MAHVAKFVVTMQVTVVRPVTALFAEYKATEEDLKQLGGDLAAAYMEQQTEGVTAQVSNVTFEVLEV